MLIKPTTDIRSSEITPKDVYLNRRNFLAGLGLSTVAAAGLGMKELLSPSTKALATDKIAGIQKSQFSTTEKITPINDVSHYNNYYEFSTEKEEPAKMAKDFRTRPWSITIDGAVPKKQKWDIDAIMKFAAPEERIYRHRCVEGWSIVVPWVGFSLSELIKRAESLGKAKFVQFTSILDMTQMPGQRQRILDWPYTEGLRMDEAMHPLTLLCFGMYGESLPNQDGAPIRLVVPWKYGFKSAKAIVKISFTDHQPSTTWNEANPHDFGFYSNVNPNVDRYHSQAHERRLGEFRPRPTLMFNGYDQVAGLYSGMDLAKNY
ncbi:MAG: protein-methionine-sulfoxide reductase catalytic subunit MsrP [Acidobacteria bacterium]|nr:MAG: protein-methionine-sulfoxide reductase catalytic subunit MsrP [Acidobacteriota bacterium]